MKTSEAARGKWHGILMHFGIPEEYLRNKNGPCPMCAGRDRWRWDDKEGAGTFFCSHCGAGDGFKLLELWTGKTFKEIAGEVDRIVGSVGFHEPKPKRDPLKRLRYLESGVVGMDGINPVRLYLQGRGVKPTQAMQYNPSVTYWEDGKSHGEYPAMLCKLVSPEGHNLTYHVTYLTQQGEKAPVSTPRKLCTPVSKLDGAAIRLFPVTDLVGVAEGIETALAVNALYGIPCWACANAGLLERFEPPQGIRTVRIFGDNDSSFSGQKAAYVLANRLSRNLNVSVEIPPEAGTDFADRLHA